MPEVAVKPDSEVRQALFAEIEETLKTASDGSRARIFSGTAKLFLKHADTLDGETISLFDEVFLRQIDGVDTQALIAFAQPLAPITKPPGRLVRQLAIHESAAVAAPVLSKAKILSDAELQAIARISSADHLRAICERDEISEALSAILIERCDQQGIDLLAKNPGAKFTVADFGTLLGRASSDERARVVTNMPVALRGAGGGSVLVRSTMIDISPGGAKLRFTGPLPVPEVFVLELTNVECTHMPCRKVWQREAITGLRFVTSLLALWGADENDSPIPPPQVISSLPPRR